MHMKKNILLKDSNRFLKTGLYFFSIILLLFTAACLSTPKTPIVIEPDEILKQHNFTDLEGNLVDIKDYLGKPLLINYWATWCKFCIKDLPVVEEFTKKFNRSHNILLLSDEPANKIKQFKNKQDYNFNYLQSSKKLSAYGITQRPAFAYFSAEGKHLETINGSVDFKILAGMVEYHKVKKLQAK